MVYASLFVVGRFLCVGNCSLLVVRRLVVDVCVFGNCCLMFVLCCLWLVDCCCEILLFAVCCSLLALYC